MTVRPDQHTQEREVHTHRWTATAHVDGCHRYEWHYRCACGAGRVSWAERSIEDDSYSLIWLDNSDKDEPCDRCEALLNGAKPEHGNEVVEAVSNG